MKRNKVALAAEKDEAWSKTSAKTPRAANKDCPCQEIGYRGILADVIVYIFAHLHRALRTEGKVLHIN